MNFVDLSGSALPHKAVILAVWKSRESINVSLEQSAPAARQASDCHVLACSPSILHAGCFLPARGRMPQYGRPRLHLTLFLTCRSRRLSWMQSCNSLGTIWHRLYSIRPSVPQYAARPVKNRFVKPLLPLHPIHPALASPPSRRR